MLLIRALIVIVLSVCIAEKGNTVNCGTNCTDIGSCSCALAELKRKNKDYLKPIELSYLKANESNVVSAYHEKLVQREIDKLQEEYMQLCVIEHDHLSNQMHISKQVVEVVSEQVRSQLEALEWYQFQVRLWWVRLASHATSLNNTIARIKGQSHSSPFACSPNHQYDHDHVKHIVLQLQSIFNLTDDLLTAELDSIDLRVQSFIQTGAFYEKKAILKELDKLGENCRQLESRVHLVLTVETLRADVEKRQFPLDLYAQIDFIIQFSSSLKLFIRSFIQELNKVHISG